MAMGSGSVAEINVTPLIDVLLVLLIIFMVILPQAPSGLRTQVPQPSKDKSVEPPARTIVVQVASGRDGQATYRINDEPLARAAVEPRLAAIFASRAEKTMFVKGDPELEYNTIAEVVDFGRHAGVTNIGIITPRVVAENQ
jgi:biopolymer transport protein ExbD/biopolymer transport protein TolR